MDNKELEMIISILLNEINNKDAVIEKLEKDIANTNEYVEELENKINRNEKLGYQKCEMPRNNG